MTAPYVPDIVHPPPVSLGFGKIWPLAGVAPSVGMGEPGDLALDYINGTLYENLNGGWQAFSGGGGGSGMSEANYSGGTPGITPSGTVALTVDTSNRHIWLYFSGAWHDTGITTG